MNAILLFTVTPPPDLPAPLAWAALAVLLVGCAYFGARLMRGDK